MKMVNLRRPPAGVNLQGASYFGGMADVNDHVARVEADGGGSVDVPQLTEFAREVVGSDPAPSLAYSAAGGYKAAVAYSLDPSDGSGDFTVARNSATATRVRPDGYIEPVAANVPRIDYASGEAALLVEAAATNLLPYYKSFARSEWTKSEARIEGDASTAGSEKVVNGNFATSDLTGWINHPTFKFDSVAYESGGARIISNGVNETSAYQSFYNNIGAITAGKLYLISYEVVVNSGSIVIGVNDTPIGSQLGNNVNITVNSSKVVSFYFTATLTDANAVLEAWNASTIACDIILKNVSIKEVTGFTCPVLNSDGSNSMAGYKLVEDTSNGLHELTINRNVTDGLTYTSSILAKKGTRDWLYFWWYDGVNAIGAYFNLNLGTLGTVISGTTATITSVADGYYRCDITGVITTGKTSITLYHRLASANNVSSYQGDGTSGIYISHANLVQESAPSSLILGTEGSTVNRIADDINTGNITSSIGQTEGTVEINFNISKLGEGRGVFTLYDGTAIDYINCYIRSYDNFVVLRIFKAGLLVMDFAASSAAVVLGDNNLIIKYDTTGYTCILNGASIKITTNAPNNLPNVLSSLYLGVRMLGTKLSWFNGRIYNVTIKKTSA